MSTIARASNRALRARRAFFTPLTRLLNPTIRRIAGRPGVPLLGLVSHQGRRSGRTYATPVGVGWTGAAFLIPLTFGATSDSCRNVLARGGCTVTWNGHKYAADQATVVDDVSARAELNAAFGSLQRFVLGAMGTHEFLRLRVLDGRPGRRARQPSLTARVRGALRGAALHLIGHGLNPLTIALASRRSLGRLAIIEHRGRHSGRVYRTPVEPRRAADGGFVIPLTWGEETDRFRNVRAAGGGVLQWRGARYMLVKPEIVAGPDARSAFHPLERVVLKLGGVRFVHLHQPREHGAEKHSIPLSER
jgi:deazaflavin-dependent oxidoreductase (nitroreductase family)